MAANLTLHQGDAERTFVEHPVEVARRALLEAADLEQDSGGNGPEWARIMRRVASALPRRGPIADR
jgi:hypothetical protein